MSIPTRISAREIGNDSAVSPHYLLVLCLGFYCLFLCRWPWIEVEVEVKKIFVFTMGERERVASECEWCDSHKKGHFAFLEAIPSGCRLSGSSPSSLT